MTSNDRGIKRSRLESPGWVFLYEGYPGVPDSGCFWVIQEIISFTNRMSVVYSLMLYWYQLNIG